MKVVLCVTVEITAATIALIERNNRPVGLATFQTQQCSYSESIDQIKALAAHLETESASTIVAACVAVAGGVKEGIVYSSSTLRSWIGQNPLSDLQELNVPIAVETKRKLDSLSEVATAAWKLVRSS